MAAASVMSIDVAGSVSRANAASTTHTINWSDLVSTSVAGGAWAQRNAIVPVAGALVVTLDWDDPTANVLLYAYGTDGAQIGAVVSTAKPKSLTINASVVGSYRIGVKAVKGAANVQVAMTIPGPSLPGPFLTLLFSRTAITAANSCVRDDTGVVLTDAVVAPTLAAMGLRPTGTLETNLTKPTKLACDHWNMSLMASWTVARQFASQYGWRFVSHSRNYASTDPAWTKAATTPYDETCGSKQDLIAQGLPGADGMFAWPNDYVYQPAMQYVNQCFDFSRKYSWGAPVTSQPVGTQSPYVANAQGVGGGACNNPALPCYTLTSQYAPSRYSPPPTMAAFARNAQPGEWVMLQSYLFVTGAKAGMWDCTSPNWQDHWTWDAERYCWSDYLTIVGAIPSNETVTDPATVGLIWGRTVAGQPGSLATLAITPTPATAAPGQSVPFTARGLDPLGADLGDLTGTTTFSIAPAGSCTANQCSASTPGAYVVTATNGAVTATAPFTVAQPPPTVLGLLPASGPVGTTVTITGTDFTNATAVTFNGVPTTFTVTSATQIVATVPSGATDGVITVTTPTGSGSSASPFSVTTGALASITVTPNGATTVPGSEVQFSARGFDAQQNDLGDVTAATTFTMDNGGTCNTNGCTPPAAGAYTVTANNGGIVSTATLVASWPAPTIASMTPGRGVPGTTITLTGTDFRNVTNVAFGGTAAAFTVTGPGVLDVTVPARPAGAAIVSVTADGGTGSFATPFTVDVVTTATPTTLVLAPGAATVAPNQPKAFSVEGFDAYGNDLGDLTGSAVFAIDHGGSCVANVCSGAAVGTYTVTASIGAASGAASLTVQAGSLASLTVTPGSVAVVPNQPVAFLAEGFDAFGNDLGDVTAAATFTIDQGGSCVGSSCSASANGSYTVTASVGAVAAIATLTVSTPSPTITSFSPAAAAIGATVTISGAGFTGVTAVQFNGVAAGFTATPTAITAVVPAAATTGTITVVAASGTVTSAAPFAVIPTIATVAPAAAATGATITIDGTGLTGATQVAFNGAPATFTEVSATRVTAVVPANATSGPLTVTTAGGTVGTATPFAVLPTITSFTPASAVTGAVVTINGSGFTGATQVAFNGMAAAFTIVGPTQITATVPSAATTGRISVTTAGGSTTSAAPFSVAPMITSISPTSGPVGTVVMITGSGLTGATRVAINGGTTTFTVVNPNQIRATVNYASSGTVTVTTPAGSATSAQSYAVTPVITSVSPTASPTGTIVSVNGSGFASVQSIAFNGAVSSSIQFVSTTQYKATVPAWATTGPVTLTTATGTATGPVFTVVPVVTSITPAVGAVGTTVTINGSGFAGIRGVTFNGVASGSVRFVNNGQITATVPTNATAGPVVVTTVSGSVTAPSSFAVVPTITSLAPTSAKAGATVTINGTGLAGTTAVAINGVAATFTIVSATRVTAVVPAAAPKGAGSVAVTCATQSASAAFTVT